MSRAAAFLVPLHRLDQSLFLAVHRGLAFRPLLVLLSVVSRLGNWPFWLGAILFTLAMGRPNATFAALHMLATAGVGGLVYKLLKERITRPRPCEAILWLEPSVPPLDRWSFPSGHTLHAVSFCVLLAHWCPEALPFVLPFAVLTGFSRIGLGLHYPFDVLAGALLGAGIAETMLSLLAPA